MALVPLQKIIEVSEYRLLIGAVLGQSPEWVFTYAGFVR